MPTRGMLSSVAAVALASIASLTLAGCGGSPTTGAGSGGTGDAYRIPAAKSGPGYTSPIPPCAQTFDVPIDKLRAESKKWETAYDELVRGAKGMGG
jgi:hypothetical protein